MSACTQAEPRRLNTQANAHDNMQQMDTSAAMVGNKLCGKVLSRWKKGCQIRDVKLFLSYSLEGLVDRNPKP